MTHADARDWPLLVAAIGAIICWISSAYYWIQFNSRFQRVIAPGKIPDGLGSRMAIWAWHHYPADCITPRRNALRWIGGFCGFSFAVCLVIAFHL
jgi:hypothetical protein